MRFGDLKPGDYFSIAAHFDNRDEGNYVKIIPQRGGDNDGCNCWPMDDKLENLVGDYADWVSDDREVTLIDMKEES